MSSEGKTRLSGAESAALEQSMTVIPLRPGAGTVGTGTRVLVNYFPVTKLPVGEIIQYDVTVTPDVPRAVKRKIFGVVEANFGKSAFGGKNVAYDGQASLYSLGPLPKNEISLEVCIDKPSQDSKHPDRSFHVRIRQVSSVNMATLDQFLNGKLNYTPYDVITALEVILRHPATAQNIVVGRSMYGAKSVIEPISGGLEVWRGFFASLRPGPGRLLLNLDTTATAFYAAGPVLKMFKAVLDANPNQPLGKLHPNEITRVERFIRGVRVEATHRGPTNQRKYRVLGVSQQSCNQTFFQDDSGQKISVAQYFERQYKIRLQDPEVPCLVVGSSQKSIFLPAEVCVIPPGQRYPRKLDENQTRDMIGIANVKPSQRFNAIKSGGPGMYLEGAATVEHLAAFQIAFGKDLMQVNGRVLPAPRLLYGKESREPEVVPSQGAWNLKDKRVETGSVVQSWAVVVIGRAQEQEIRAFLSELITTCQDTGVSFAAPARSPPLVIATPDIEASCRQAAQRALQTFKSPAQFLLVVLPSTDSRTYGQVKLCTDTQLGIPSQCMQMKHARRPNKQYCANLCLKINLKLGGTNVSLGRQMAFIAAKPTMVLGADVTHPGPGEADGRPSIAAVVASYDIKLSRYGANVRVQPARQEIISDLKDMVREHLETFIAANKRRPERLLFYRDGVSEGQFAQVLQYELNAIKAAAMQIDPAYKPTVTLILVQKRHHTRFAPLSQQDSDRSGNVLAGTVVDTAICHPTQFDFFLCSHAGLQGTSRPTHYHVIYDDHSFTANDLQTLTYQLCYTFARCTRAVSVATPAYYAHLVAFRARFHFNDAAKFCPVVPSLQRNMYFI